MTGGFGRSAVGGVVLAALLAGGTASCGVGSLPGGSQLGSEAAPSAGAFPAIDEAALTAGQRRFLAVARAEHAAQRPGTTYSQGADEPWCADFVSWVAKQVGSPLVNPHSGGWRIPGVLTLQESLQQSGRWRAPDSGYAPKLGDIVLYAEGSPFGQHTNYVLAYRDGVQTTVGGNENGAIRVSEHRVGPELRMLGYGVR